MRRSLLILALLIAVGIAAVTALVILDAPATAGIAAGTQVGGLDVGGLDLAQAEETVSAAFADRLRRPIAVRAGESEYGLVPAELGFSVDLPATMSGLSAEPSDVSLLEWLRGRLIDGVEDRDIQVVYRLDEARFTSAVDEFALPLERLVNDARLFMDGLRPKVVAAESGILLDRDTLRDRIIEVLDAGGTELEAPLEAIPPKVTTEEAQAALAAVRTALSESLTLSYQGESFELSPSDLAGIVALNPSGQRTGLPISFDTEEARGLLETRLAGVQDPPIEAEIVPNEGGKGFTVKPGREGTLIEWSALFSTMARVVSGSSRRYVPIPTTTVQPRLTTLDAQELQNRREIASFTTFFSPADAARVNNIRQVAVLLDGAIVRPGEVFSFNGTAGPRTVAAGFDEAPVIRGGVLTPGVGGGICQVSTTLFNAVFFAGLPIVERKPHSFYIDHYPVGRDATVSYGSTDFRFRNDSETLILVSVATTERSVTVSLAAPRWDRTVTYETSDFYDMVEPRSSAEEPRRLRDPALPRGTVSPIEAGVSGRKVDVRRTVSDSSGILFEDVFSSSYGPKDYVIRVGG